MAQKSVQAATKRTHIKRAITVLNAITKFVQYAYWKLKSTSWSAPRAVLSNRRNEEKFLWQPGLSGKVS